MAQTNLLWKPVSDSDGNLAIAFPYEPGNVVIRDSEGTIIARGRPIGPGNGYQNTYRFPLPGSSYNNVTVEDDTGRSFDIEDGSRRYDNVNYTSTGEDPGTNSPEDGTDGAPGETPGGGLPPDPFLVDPSIITTPDPISFPVIPIADFNFTDPIENTRLVGEFNREQSEINFVKAMERARELNAEELASVKEFAQGMSDFQLGLLDTENAFNQQQRLKAAEVAIPGVQGLFARQRERAETLAGGRLLETSEDRALELAARSASAEGNVIRGFGDDSVVGRRTSDILTAQQRLGLQQVGEGFLNQSVQLASGILMDQPLKANIAQRLPAQPAVPLTALVPQLQQNENALSTIDPSIALQTSIQQEIFTTNNEARTNEFNATGINRANEFNSTQMFDAILARAGIVAGNVAALNEGQRENFNVEESRRIAAEQRKIADKAIAAYKRNGDLNRFYQGLGAAFGGLANVPQGVWDYLGEQLGFNVEDKAPDDSDSDDGGSDGGGSNNGGSDDSGSDDEDRAPQEDRPNDFPEDDEEDTPFQPGDESTPEGEDAPDPTDTESETPKMFHKSKRNRTVRLAGIKKRQTRLEFRRINNSVFFNSGATLNINIRDDEDFDGVI